MPLHNCTASLLEYRVLGLHITCLYELENLNHEETWSSLLDFKHIGLLGSILNTRHERRWRHVGMNDKSKV